jgi:general secretion pathway protein D
MRSRGERLAVPYSAAYRNAEIDSVVNQVLGSALGVDYTISPQVRGQITLRMSNIETHSGVIRHLRDALATVGVSLIDRGDFIAIVQGGTAGGAGNVVFLEPGEPAPPGTSSAVFSPSNVTPSDVGALVLAMAPGARQSLVDDRRNILIYSGEASALTAVSNAIAQLDIDWFNAVSTGLFELEHAQPGDVIGELRALLGPRSASVEMLAIERLSTVAVLSVQPDLLRRVESWINHLDQPRGSTTSAGQLVYEVRHSDPADLLNSLYQLLGMGNYQPGGGDFVGGAFAPGQMTNSPSSGQQSRASTSDYRSTQQQGGVQIGAAPNQNIILVRGEPDQVAEIEELLELLDRPRPQVLIEAAIVEVTLTDEMRYGVDWSGIINEHVAVAWSGDASPSADPRFPGLAATYLNTGLEAAISALSATTELEVISRPSVLALHNEQAELQVGDQVPVVLQSAVSIENPDAPLVNQTAYRNTGVILTVTPQIRAGGVVEVEVSQEVSGVAQTTSSGIDSPTITQRRIASTLLVPSGEAVALGGLISTRSTNGSSGVPILRGVPVVRRLFSSESIAEDRTELLVLLTPTIITDPSALRGAMNTLPDALARLEERVRTQ